MLGAEVPGRSKSNAMACANRFVTALGLCLGVGEDAVRAHFESCGAVFGVRRRPRERYGFVVFRERAARDRAVAELDGSQLSGRALRVREASSPSRLFVGGLPKVWGQADFESAVRVLELRGLEETRLILNREGLVGCRGYGFLQFYNHQCALEARRQMSAPGFSLGSPTPECSPTVNLADEPKTTSVADGRAFSAPPTESRSLFVPSVPVGATEADLMLAFGPFGVVDSVQVRSRPSGGQGETSFAFVHFMAVAPARAAEAAARAGEIAVFGQQLAAAFRHERGQGAGHGSGCGSGANRAGPPPAQSALPPEPAPKNCCAADVNSQSAVGCGCSCDDCTCSPLPPGSGIAQAVTINDTPAPFPGGDPIFQQPPGEQIQARLQNVLPPPDRRSGYPAQVVEALNVLKRYAANHEVLREANRWAPY